MIETRSAAQRRELGEFIRAQRERLDPTAIGLAERGRRRTPGLRREEIAQLCGLSTTWYTWIEQGRDVSVSPMALARMAATLRLGRAERAYLFDLAGKRDPAPGGGGDGGDVPAALLACVEAIGVPAYVLDRSWTARWWNTRAEQLFTGWLDQPGERNLLRFVFQQPAARALIVDWSVRARRVVAEFRASNSAYVTGPALRGFIDSMRHESPEFAEFWNQFGVLDREGGERIFNHPRDGLLRFVQVTFDLAGRPDLKLTMLVPDGAATPPVVPALASAPKRTSQKPGQARLPAGKRTLRQARPV